MSKKLRIHQFLSRTGLFSYKRDVLDALHKGLVTVDGRVVKDKDFQFKLSLTVKYNGKEVNMLKASP
jgi:16S rRNA U516 pseudouridylate synthase RsuA-like enzyme